MATVILTPFPRAAMTAQRPAAIACLKESIVGGARLTDDRAAALGEMASALVERFAPDAPQAVRNEAVIRVAGWTYARQPRDIQALSFANGMSLNFRERSIASPDALRNSGARSLLSPWRARRALPAAEDGSSDSTPTSSSDSTPTSSSDGVSREELDRILDERLRNHIEWGGS